jgi:alkanesulfonate monooxygenase SsuD/methylene tetrahydromethanopterin reductase-like flavin-dependent oxidoreductase (luciferase family)
VQVVGARPAPGAAGDGADGRGHAPRRLLFAGTPDVIVEQIRAFHAATGVGVLDLIFTAGQTPPPAVRRGLELFGREALPRVRAIGEPTESAAAPPARAQASAPETT